MKNLLIFAAGFLYLSSCNVITGNGNIQTEKRKTADFSAVKNSGSFSLEISNGNSFEVSVENDENLLPFMITEVNNGTLHIHYRSGIAATRDHAKVYITVPTLDKLSVSGSGDITLKDPLKNSKGIELSVSGSGNIKGPVDAPSIEVSVSGSGNISLSGRTRDLDARIGGSGDLNCSGLLSENTTVKVSGSGNAHVFANVHLEASVSGSGEVYYRGNPPAPEIHKSGSGSVQPE